MKFFALIAATSALKLTTDLPLCDGSNGVVGVNCLASGNYPRKLTGTPYAPAG